AHRPPYGAAAFRVDASRAVHEEHRPVRPRSASLSREHLGRRVRGPMVAGTASHAADRAGGRGRRLILVAGTQTRRLRVWQDRIDAEVEVRGDGPPLIWLHGPWGLPIDVPFLEVLARTNTVYAPRHPGTCIGDPDAISHLEYW